jgi:beta-glucosidase
MPFAVPTSHRHLPPFDPRARRITYDLWHGYRRLHRERHPSAFPFGFGLSYTAFVHSDLTVELLTGSEVEEHVMRVRVTVANVGSIAAAEVLQVYGEPPGRVVDRPARMLVGFCCVLLQPGQAEPVQIDVPLQRLAFFDEAADAFALEAGRHRVRVARHAEDDGIGAEIKLEAGLVGR